MVDCVFECGCRIIPARAGPTYRYTVQTHHRTDHPRSCGANWMIPARTCTRCGSSPLVRGQQDVLMNYDDPFRIIPARAGPTFSGVQTVLLSTDHPRSCGANPLCLSRSSRLLGSSPLVRGQHRDNPLHVQIIRIIPARAGPTLTPAVC